MKIGTQIASLVAWLLVSFAPGWIGSHFMPGEWYRALQKPSFNPPGYLFAPVWTLLYILMGIAAWLVWKRAGFAGARIALILFVAQLILNGLWSWLFFGLQRPGVALIDILLLWGLIIATIVSFWQKSAPAGMLLLPYIAWVSFASLLNFEIWRLNRSG
jgi:tryptophan-rich sensory protein